MKIPLNWLKEFIKFDLKPYEVADKLTAVSLEVDKINKDVLDIEINPNRGDCLSILGIAREMSAILNKKISIPVSKFKETTQEFLFSINIKDPSICPRYAYRIITGVKVFDSPKNIVEKLKSVNLRSVSNIVDVTNFVMMELGQPLHAFDYDKISKSKEMIIRKSEIGEEIETLDGKIHKLGGDEIVIENDKKLIDLAGIMGGANSEVDKNTKTIILQAALFNSTLIRRASKKLRFSTEASYRYERGVDPCGNIEALNRATDLILKTAGGSATKIVDIVMHKSDEKIIKINTEKIKKLIGFKITDKEIKNILNKIGFTISSDFTKVTVPSWRIYDINDWPDIAEEIARQLGYDKIESSVIEEKEKPILNKEFIFEQNLAFIVKKFDFVETLSYSFTSKKDLGILEIDDKDCAKIINPISPDFQYLRPKLLPSVLKQIAKNPFSPDIRMFEIGKIFTNKEEKKELIVALTGKQKNLLEIKDEIITELNLTDFPCKIYMLEQKILDYYKIRRPIHILEADLSKIFSQLPESSELYKIDDKKVIFKPISKFPPVIRDLAFIIDKKIPAKEIISEITKIDKNVFIVDLFDEFESKKFGVNMKNIAFHVWYNSLEKTLPEKEINSLTKKITDVICKKYNAKIRDF